MHLMIQADAARQFLSDGLLRDQGLLSRILVAHPDSIAGARPFRDPAPEDDAAIQAYGARLLALLEATWPLIPGTPNELEPRTISLSTPASALWKTFYDHVERQCSPGGDLNGIGDFAAKAAEHAARIAGVLTIVEDLNAAQIGETAMANAIVLVDWYLAEACRLQDTVRTDPKLLSAQKLLDWLRGRGALIEFRDILTYGPAPFRTKAAAEVAIELLLSHHLIVEVCRRPRRFRVNPGAPWNGV